MIDFQLRRQISESTNYHGVRTAAACSNSLKRTLEVQEEFAFRVLDGGRGRRLSGKIAYLAGRRVIAQVSELLQTESCVRIDLVDAFVLGVVIGSWHDGPGIFVALDLHQVLNTLECWSALEPSIPMIARTA
jgi:hypothetical protein